MIKIVLPRQDIAAWLQMLLATDDMEKLLASVVEWLRRGGVDGAGARMAQLLEVLRGQPELAAAVGSAFFKWLEGMHIVSALVGLGIFSRKGFSREAGKRLYDRFNPPPHQPKSLYHVFLMLFCRHRDGAWLAAIPAEYWQQLAYVLAEQPVALAQNIGRQFEHAQQHALEMLAIWVAAEGLDPDLVRIEPRLLEVDSPFLALNQEIARLLDHVRSGSEERFDDGHLQVMLEQSGALVERLRKRGAGAGAGSSIAVAHLLERLDQTLARLKFLLLIQTASDVEERSEYVIRLWQLLASAASDQRSLSMVWGRSVKMLARSISQNTGDRGEKYITTTRSEYFAMLRSASAGGVLIALMALLKLRLGMMDLGKGAYAFWASLDYGLGFVLINMLHGTVATKQPAMTAANIAQQVERGGDGRTLVQKLAKLGVDLIRSQTVAVFGNVSMAVLVAMAVSYGYVQYAGEPVLSLEKAQEQFAAVQPFTRPTLLYAAVAGVWLFCSGIISGFFDNRADYLNMRERLRRHPVLARFLPLRWRTALAEYLHRNYGVIMGNFIFGVMLGSTAYVGQLFGLNIDIRHVAFSSANVSYAAAVSGSSVLAFAWYMVCVLLIGVVNLWVSFTLTLWVALRSRDAHIDSVGKLLKSVWQLIAANPWSLLFPVQAASQVLKNQRAPAETKEQGK